MNRSFPVFLALDPGQTTGYAIACKPNDITFVAYNQAKMDHRGFYHWMQSIQPTHCICESLAHLHGKQTIGDFHHSELIGIVKLLYPDVYMQPASIQGKMSFWSNQRLKDWGLYIRGREHGRSAMKHLLEWCMFRHGSKYGPHEFQLVEEMEMRNDYLNDRLGQFYLIQ
jgi:hypothetical protein